MIPTHAELEAMEKRLREYSDAFRVLADDPTEQYLANQAGLDQGYIFFMKAADALAAIREAISESKPK